MDFLMHAIIGFFLGELSDAPNATILLMIASVLPDVDLIYIALGRLSYFKHHRKITHSIFGIPLFAGLLAGVFSYLTMMPFSQAFLLSVIGMAIHVLFDLTNHFGTEVFYPLKKKRYAWEFTNVIEVPLYAISLAMLGIYLAGKERNSVKLALVLFFLYLAFKGALHRAATNIAKKRFGKSRAIPHFWNIFSWHIIHEEKNKYILSDLNLFTGKLRRAKALEKAPQILREVDQKLAAFFDFAEYPVIEVDHNLIKIRDLRFFASDHFMMVLKTDANKIVSEKFKS